MKKILLSTLLSSAILAGCASTEPRQFTLQNEPDFTTEQIALVEQVNPNDADALYQAGQLLLTKSTQASNVAQGLVDLKAAAKRGQLDAISLLGDLYYKGYGDINQNYSEALQWFEQGSKLNDAYSLYSAGFMYERGQGTSVDVNKAVSLYEKASAQGSMHAALQLAFIYDKGEGGIALDHSKAATWYEKAAELGSDTARYNLAVSYQYGEGVAVDLNKAFELFAAGADEGHGMSLYSVGNFYYEGVVVKKNYKQALDYYFQAALQDVPQAQADIGYMYYHGYGIEKDPIMAMAWFLVSADRGFKGGQNNAQHLAAELSQEDLLQAQKIKALIEQEIPAD